MRRYDEFVAPALEQIQYLTPRNLDARGLRWQYFLDTIWQQPAVYRRHYPFPFVPGGAPRGPPLSEADTAAQARKP